MLKVGLTGGIACGKTTVCTLFNDLYVPIIDADTIAKQLTEPEQACFQQIIDCFGQQFILENGQLDRKKLRRLIFSEPSAKQQIEAILHPKVRQRLAQQANMISDDYCILSVPLLIEAEMTDLVDRVLVIDCDPEIQLQRLCQRDHLTSTDAENIMANQCDRQQRLELADDIIVNNTTQDNLFDRVKQLDQFYRQLG